MNHSSADHQPGQATPSDQFRRLVPADPDQITKHARILHALACGRSLNRFEAIGLGDTALNSTVSLLRNRYKVDIAGITEVVRGRHGYSRVVRYRLDFHSWPDGPVHVLSLLSEWGFVDPLRLSTKWQPGAGSGGQQ